MDDHKKRPRESSDMSYKIPQHEKSSSLKSEEKKRKHKKRQRSKEREKEHHKKHKKEKRKEKEKKRSHKKDEKKKRKRRKSEPVQLSQFMAESDAPRSAISGKKIKMKIHKSKEDKEMEASRDKLRAFYNAMV